MSRSGPAFQPESNACLFKHLSFPLKEKSLGILGVMTRQRECLVKEVSEGGKIARVRGVKMRGGPVMWRGGEDRRQEGEETGLTPRL